MNGRPNCKKKAAFSNFSIVMCELGFTVPLRPEILFNNRLCARDFIEVIVDKAEKLSPHRNRE